MKSLFLIIFIFVSGWIFSQTAVIKGKVLDQEMNLEPVPFADVTLKGTSFGASTDFDGLFEFTRVPEGSYILVVSFIGYQTVELPIEAKLGETLELELQISSDNEMLDEILIRTERRQNTEAIV